jgi:hypothetical protein
MSLFPKSPGDFVCHQLERRANPSPTFVAPITKRQINKNHKTTAEARCTARPPPPNIHKLASEGVRLLNYNVGTQGVPSCSAFLTGHHAIRSGTTKVVWGMMYDLVQWVEARVGWFFGLPLAEGRALKKEE